MVGAAADGTHARVRPLPRGYLGGVAIDGAGDPERNETELERLDRNLNELLQELRVALPGVQVLFAFLLTVPFSQRFSELSRAQEHLYYGVLLCTAVASALLIAPTMHHRLLFRHRRKREIVRWANRLAIVGLTVLALAMTGTIVLITDLLYGSAVMTVAAGLVVVLFGVLWYAIPWRLRRDEIHHSDRLDRPSASGGHPGPPSLQEPPGSADRV
jgi:hypothetical protein